MTSKEMELNKNDPRLSKLLRSPSSYKKRKPIKVRASETYHVSDYWDGGSRTSALFVNPNTGQTLTDEQVGFEKQTMANPFSQRMGSVRLTPDVAVVESSVFCGKDMGIRIVVHPDTFNKMNLALEKNDLG